MKKFVFGIVNVMLITTLFIATNVFGEMPLRILINGERLFFPDAQPFIDENGRTQTPSRFIGEELGATVTWDGTAQKATFIKGNKELVLYIGKKDYEFDGKKLQMDTAAILKEGRTFVPARYVAEAFGATVSWDGVIKTVYIDTSANSTPIPTPTAQEGTVESYDGIAFDKVNDIDQYGRMSVEKSKEFVLKLADQLEFVKENGKYYIKCDYPELPKDFQWTLTIRVFYKGLGEGDWFTPTTRIKGNQIPRDGVFKKEITSFIDAESIESYIISIAIDESILTNPPEYSIDKNTGHLSIRNFTDNTIRDVDFVPKDSSIPYTSYTEKFNYNKMFQW